MAKITCPKCHEVFELKDSEYQEILKEIKDSTYQNELNNALRQKEEIFKRDLLLKEQETKEASKEEIASLKEEITKLQNEARIKNAEEESKMSKKLLEVEKKYIDQIREKEIIIKTKEEEVRMYRDFKAKQSVKLLGESLEQHCEIAFNQIRATAFPHAYFEKDSDIAPGTKGDYIFREMANGSEELISIMFDMKNEADESVNKKTNESHLDKLDKDRKKKGCEYAILVSTLEPDNELYNGGIVDMSYKYEKMYVIRPQFFIPIITVLRNAALKAVNDKNEIALLKNREIDVTNFENKLSDFQKGFNTSYERASKKFDVVIDELNKTIDHLVKTRDALMQTGTNFRIANDKVQEITISKLTYGNPTMKAKFEEAKLLDVKDKD